MLSDLKGSERDGKKFQPAGPFYRTSLVYADNNTNPIHPCSFAMARDKLISGRCLSTVGSLTIAPTAFFLFATVREPPMSELAFNFTRRPGSSVPPEPPFLTALSIVTTYR